MFRHRFPVFIVVVAIVSSAPSAHAQAKMYWTDWAVQGIMRANLDGTDIEEVVSKQPYAKGVAIDTVAGKVYWAIQAYDLTQHIMRASLDGSDVEHVMVADVTDLALDPQLNLVYWVWEEGSAIKRANLDGSNMEVLVAGLYRARGIALDLTAGKMYWMEGFQDDKIRRADLDGSNVEVLVLMTSYLSSLSGIALDVAAGKMYWSDSGIYKIQRANLDGSEVEDVIAIDYFRPQGIALDPFGGKIYWARPTHYGPEIQRANLDGTDIETLVAEGYPSEIALIYRDCNQNGILDDQDIADETSADCDGNGIPDECQPDCDNDGTPDPGELPPCGTSSDCDENGVPDECEAGGLEDCNANGTFDLCDIYVGTSGDCNGNAIPDDCDVDPSDPDGNGEVSEDLDESGIPDECECFESSSPVPDRLDLPGNPISQKVRYLSFTGGDAGHNQAVRVVFQDLPAPYETWNGAQLWVQEPQRHCEGCCQKWPPEPDNPPDYGCPHRGIEPPWYWGADFGCEPFWTEWSQYDVVHASNEGIVPEGVYDIQVIDDTCWLTIEGNYSPALTLSQSTWADAINNCATFPCGPPDGVTGIVDVTAILDLWKNLPNNIQIARADFEGSPAGDHRTPDQYIGITDVTYCLSAFLGDTYPGPGFPPPSHYPYCP